METKQAEKPAVKPVGRPKGSKSMTKHALDVRLRKSYGKKFNVIMEMMEMAMTTEDMEKKFAMLKECAPYIVPKKKHVEVDQHVTGDGLFVVIAPEQMTPEEWDKLTSSQQG